MRIDAAKKLKQIRGLTAFFAQGGKKNQIKTTAIQFSESDNPFAAFKSRLDYEYKDEMLVPFFIALSTTQIITLFGKPGTGKTTFVSKTAKALGAKCTIISVQNNWTDSSDLLGYYNPLKGTYESTNFVEALIDAYYDWIQYSVESPLHIICLDEMNLARMEYYFAEFLSLMQRESNERIVRLLPVYLQDEILSLFPNDEEKNIEEEREAILKDPEKRKKHKLGRYLEFAIPPNVRFVGTINNDDSMVEDNHDISQNDRLFGRSESLLQKDIKSTPDYDKRIVSGVDNAHGCPAHKYGAILLNPSNDGELRTLMQLVFEYLATEKNKDHYFMHFCWSCGAKLSPASRVQKPTFGGGSKYYNTCPKCSTFRVDSFCYACKNNSIIKHARNNYHVKSSTEDATDQDYQWAFYCPVCGSGLEDGGTRNNQRSSEYVTGFTAIETDD